MINFSKIRVRVQPFITDKSCIAQRRIWRRIVGGNDGRCCIYPACRNNVARKRIADESSICASASCVRIVIWYERPRAFLKIEKVAGTCRLSRNLDGADTVGSAFSRAAIGEEEEG